MSKPVIKIHDLVESDFRKIQKLLAGKYLRSYSLDYIRKVCKGKRKNTVIKEMAEKYASILEELEQKLEELSKDNPNFKNTRQ